MDNDIERGQELALARTKFGHDRIALERKCASMQEHKATLINAQ
jgi:hypothetical protein